MDYAGARVLVERCHGLVRELEQIGRPSPTLQSDISQALGDLEAIVAELTRRLDDAPPATKRTLERQRTSLREEVDLIRRDVAKLSHPSVRERRERDELMHRTSSKHAAATAVNMDLLAHEAASMKRSDHRLSQVLDMASTSLAELGDDESILKRSRRRLLDIGTSLGLSQGIMRMIDRRDLVDRWLVYCGMVLVLLLIIVAYWYLRPYFHNAPS